MRSFHRQSVVSLSKRLVVKAFLWVLRERMELSSYNMLLRAAMTSQKTLLFCDWKFVSFGAWLAVDFLEDRCIS